VVATVDVESRNVYFELGLAIGPGKDVLLVTESTLIVTLPSDLRSWECLTYEKGNHEELRDKAARFFEANYHLVRSGDAP